VTALAVFVGGGLGSLLRWSVALLLGRHAAEPFPFATLAVNLAGCFLAGVLAALFAERLPVSPPVRFGLTTGFLGGLTTFSTFGLETARLFQSGHAGLAVGNVLANVVPGVAGAALGLWCVGRSA
jgi:CrcB protein